MRYIIFVLFIFLNTSFTSEKREKQFSQDVVTIHSLKQGLPDGEIDKITLQKNDILASTNKGTYKWDGKIWKSAKGIKEKPSDIP
ncbi:MAG: hypothetical protein KAK04_11010, partial [Cyclobacteriaceae bacterium]|nr:hypothetical protein [Cyclobacteriaceae bacterium]